MQDGLEQRQLVVELLQGQEVARATWCWVGGSDSVVPGDGRASTQTADGRTAEATAAGV